MGFCITWNQKRGEEIPPVPFKCPHCDFVGKNAQSLALHLRRSKCSRPTAS